MLVINGEGMDTLSTLKREHKDKYGFPYLSPSSMNDFQDCAEKFELRKEHRGLGLTSTAGTVIHSMAESVGREILRRQLLEDEGFAEAKEKVLDTLNISDVWDSAVSKATSGVALKLLTGELLARDKDRDFMIDARNTKQFFEYIKPLVANKDFLDGLLNTPAIGYEVEGYWENKEDRLFYGFIDRLSVRDRTLEVIDYKTIWSKGSRTNWDKLSVTLQGWMYYTFVKDIVEKDPGLDNIEVIFKFVEIDLPRDYNKIKPENLVVKQFDKVMKITPEVEDKFLKTINSVLTLKDNDLGFIGNSKFGCGSCQYKSFCKYFEC